MSEPTIEEKLALAREKKAKREAAVEVASQARELEILELEEEYETKFGPRGNSWELIDTVEGPVVIRLGESVLFKKFNAEVDAASTNKKPVEIAHQHNFVLPNVLHPDPDKFKAMVAKRPGMLGVLSTRLWALYNGRANENAGKA